MWKKRFLFKTARHSEWQQDRENYTMRVFRTLPSLFQFIRIIENISEARRKEVRNTWPTSDTGDYIFTNISVSSCEKITS